DLDESQVFPDSRFSETIQVYPPMRDHSARSREAFAASETVSGAPRARNSEYRSARICRRSRRTRAPSDESAHACRAAVRVHTHSSAATFASGVWGAFAAFM